MPGRRPFSTRRRGPRMPKGCSGLQVSEDGQHPAVVGVRGCQPELAEDVHDVLLDGPLGTTKIPAIAALERPSAIRASPSRSLAVSVPSLPVRRLAPMSCVTTSGSRAVPPPPAKTAPSLRKRGPAGRFPLVPPCVIVCRCRSWRSNRYGQIDDIVRAEGAVRGTACFADSRPFYLVPRAPDCSPDWCMPYISGRPVLHRPAHDGRQAGFVRTRGRGRLPHRLAPSHRSCHGGGDRGRVARRRVEDWHGAVASDAARGSGRCASGGAMHKGFPVSPRRDWIWLSRSCTCRGLVMYLSYTVCRSNNRLNS